MTKILNTTQIRELDAFTMAHEPIASIDLMERACIAFVDWFVTHYPSAHQSILIVCGTGNNGGDGLGIARLLHQRGFGVTVVIVKVSSGESKDFKINREKLPTEITIDTIGELDDIDFPKTSILIDAIFGSGLSRPLNEFATKVINRVNNLHAIRIAVDIPSGLFADSYFEGVALQAKHTATFQLPKLSFLLPQSFSSVGEWQALDIGLDRKFIDDASTPNYYIDKQLAKSLFRSRQKFNHKGSFGHSLVMAGSYGKIGACILATKAALRIGSGLVTAFIPKCGYIPLQVAAPEAMVITGGDEDFLSGLPELNNFNSVGIGPGIGTTSKVISLLKDFLTTNSKPCVLDADALNILAKENDLQKLVCPDSILTPHPGEFERLVGKWSDDFERLKLQRELASRLDCIIVLKGAHTSIALPNGDVFFNSTGNPAMATGGSGDALTGILIGLLAQKYSPTDAAILGVYLHGLAGDLVIKAKGSIIASDIIDQIPSALKRISEWH